MSEYTDEPHDWPLRDASNRLRPPARTEAQIPDDDEEPVVDVSETEPQLAPEPVAEESEEPVYGEVVVEEAVEEAVAPVVDEHAEAELRVPDGYSMIEGEPTGQRRSVAIVVSRFNGEITNRLLDAALAELDEAGVARDAVLVMPVPGAFELPIAAMALAKTRRYSCVVALGCVIRGETPHFDFVASEAASGLQLAGIETGVPVSFGLLTCDTAEQAEARIDRGATAARTALEMADVFAQLRATAAPRSGGCRETGRRCPRSALSAGRSPGSATIAAIRWWRRGGASTPTSSVSASWSAAHRSVPTSARAASRATRSPRRSAHLGRWPWVAS
jgi:6,7-dimethyl-8-ribityllumazine synthase